MSVKEILREEVKGYINNADEELLLRIKALLKTKQEDETDTGDNEVDWDELPNELKMSIDRAIKQADEGGGMPHEEVVAKYYSQWFKK